MTDHSEASERSFLTKHRSLKGQEDPRHATDEAAILVTGRVRGQGCFGEIPGFRCSEPFCNLSGGRAAVMEGEIPFLSVPGFAALACLQKAGVISLEQAEGKRKSRSRLRTGRSFSISCSCSGMPAVRKSIFSPPRRH